MITQEKLTVYKLFKGDIDMWIRRGSPTQKRIMEEGDWSLIDSLIQDITIVTQGLTTETYAKNASEKLSKNCDSEETIQALRKLAGQ